MIYVTPPPKKKDKRLSHPPEVRGQSAHLGLLPPALQRPAAPLLLLLVQPLLLPLQVNAHVVETRRFVQLLQPLAGPRAACRGRQRAAGVLTYRRLTHTHTHPFFRQQGAAGITWL